MNVVIFRLGVCGKLLPGPLYVYLHVQVLPGLEILTDT